MQKGRATMPCFRSHICPPLSPRLLRQPPSPPLCHKHCACCFRRCEIVAHSVSVCPQQPNHGFAQCSLLSLQSTGSRLLSLSFYSVGGILKGDTEFALVQRPHGECTPFVGASLKIKTFCWERSHTGNFLYQSLTGNTLPLTAECTWWASPV